MKTKNSCQIELQNIERLLLDFEEFSQKKILISIKIELTTKLSKIESIAIKNLKKLYNAMLISINSAINNKIIWNRKDVNIFLRIIDFFIIFDEFEGNTDKELSKFIDNLIEQYIYQINLQTKINPLKEYSNYINIEAKQENKENFLKQISKEQEKLHLYEALNDVILINKTTYFYDRWLEITNKMLENTNEIQNNISNLRVSEIEKINNQQAENISALNELLYENNLMFAVDTNF